ncbi:MAG: winged helix-turn-helix domain-containing protein [Chloroflexi bacterium]|nr:winged helix-turn-helix domain-containing protein [Chloroflexota bacterium]
MGSSVLTEPQPRATALNLRRLTQSRDLPPVVVVGSLCLSCLTFDLKVGSKTVLLTPAEFQLLFHLMSHAGQVFSSEQLLCEVWGYSPGAGRPELIRAHVKNLRIKIENNPRAPIYLRTVGAYGYTIGDGESSVE